MARKCYAQVCKNIREEHGMNFVEFVELYSKLGYSSGKLAKLLGVNYKTMNRWLDMRGLVMPRRPKHYLFNNVDRCIDATRENGIANRKTVIFNGEEVYFAERERQLGLCNSGIAKRLKLGWSLEKALTTPKKQRRGDTAWLFSKDAI